MTESAFERFVDIIRALRDPEKGCPWDLKQTHISLKPYLIEEAYELIDAIDQADDTELRAELGDVLLQVVLHAQVAADRSAFTIEDVIKGVSDKMIRRHPHVFGEVSANTPEEVVKNWNEIKQAEKEDAGVEVSALDGIPKSMPAAARAHQLGQKAAQLNFDWSSTGEVWRKVEEEVEELRQEIQSDSAQSAALKQRRMHELGDLIFASAQLARWLGTDLETCLRHACDRFEQRFRKLEAELGADAMAEASEEELEQRWQRVKKQI